MSLISELDEKDKSIVFGMIEMILAKKKFKDFFNKNVPALKNAKKPCISAKLSYFIIKTPTKTFLVSDTIKYQRRDGLI